MKASGYKRNDNDWYIEPTWVVKALLDVEPFDDGISWDPCCGSGTIPNVMGERGLRCIGTDLIDRGYGGGVDFFQRQYQNFSYIVSNPPYGRLQEFIDHALNNATQKVAVIARLAFLESAKRKEWFEKGQLARVWVSTKRVSMPPGGFDVKASGGSTAYAWFVFDKAHVGDPRIRWL